MNRLARSAISWTEMGLVPDVAIRAGIRRLLTERLDEVHADDAERAGLALRSFISTMQSAEVAPLPKLANEQHYELPAAFFTEVLGAHRKYSSCYWPPGVRSLNRAEAEALSVTCARAGIEDGMSVLDLGCGWGSLSLWIAQHYPDCRITSVSNSKRQRQHIVTEATRRGLSNIDVLTRDMNEFEAPDTYDRVVSVEMFEHLRNYDKLLGRVARWLKPEGKLFVHIFCHREFAYLFETTGDDNWMGRYFFTGGIMPSVGLIPSFDEHVSLEEQWVLNGTHYQRTAEAWRLNLERERKAVLQLFAEVYGAGEANRWYQRWRLFFLACEELFGYRNGEEWYVAHYRFTSTRSHVTETYAAGVGVD